MYVYLFYSMTKENILSVITEKLKRKNFSQNKMNILKMSILPRPKK